MVHPQSGPRTVAVVGPFGTGKTTLFEAMLAQAGTPLARGAPRGGHEPRVAHTSFMDERWALIDCPGSVECAHATAHALSVADLALVVVDPSSPRALTAAPLLHTIGGLGLPFLVFINHIDTLVEPVRDVIAALQPHAPCPLVQREIPVRTNEQVTGFIDVISERAYQYGTESAYLPPPASLATREAEARAGLVEVLADHDDALLEKLIEEQTISSAEIFARLRQEQADHQVAGVLFGAADRGWGVFRLWKALRHDTPPAGQTAAHRCIAAEGPPVAQIFHTLHAGQGGKLSWARIWRGRVRDGAPLDGTRVGGLWKNPAGEASRVAEAQPGDIVALGRLETATTGTVLGDPAPAALPVPTRPPPVHALAIAAIDRKDDVRLSGALQKLLDEFPALTVVHDTDSGQTLLAGPGEMQLRAALDRLTHGFAVPVTSHPPQVAYRETIRHNVMQHGRLKRQTGGHGQFADVKLHISPLPRGSGFRFVDRIVGGAVPRNYIPAVAAGAEEGAARGAFGHKVVDMEVTLVDGGFHDVDSSEMAFRTAARQAMHDAFPQADPVLLEPVDHVTITVPTSYSAAAQRLLTARRGQILGYEEHPGRPGWDDVQALVPQADLFGMIIELRSQTMGLGTYVRRFDHLAELHGKAAAQVRAAAG
jgi:elongation factor G